MDYYYLKKRIYNLFFSAKKMKLKYFSISNFFVITLFFLSNCATGYNLKMHPAEKKFYRGHFLAASRELIPFVNQKDKDQLLFLMEAALMLHTAREHEKSNMLFLKAGKIARNVTTSISKQAKALILNERSTNYKGEDFERVLIHMFTGINFILLQKPDEARIEFKKVNDQLNAINIKRGKKYKQNIMAKYLTAIAFEMIGDMENDDNDREFAYIEYKQIYRLKPNLKIVHRDLQRMAKKLEFSDDYARWISKFGKRDNIPNNSGELIVIFQSGKGPVKISRGPLMKERSMAGAIRISLKTMTFTKGLTLAALSVALHKAENPIPRFKKGSNRIKRLMVYIKGKNHGSTILIENIEKTAIKNLQEDYRRIQKKVAYGIVTKLAVAMIAGLATRSLAKQAKKIKALGAFGQIISSSADILGAVAAAGTGAALIAQIKPDLRCWHTLPANLQLGRFFLKEGSYEIEIKFIDKYGEVARIKRENILIQKGKKTFLNYRTLR